MSEAATLSANDVFRCSTISSRWINSRAPKVAENFGNFTALAPDDGLGLFMVVGGQPAADLDPVAVPDEDGIAAIEAPLDLGTPAGSRLCPRRALPPRPVDGDGAPRLERARDPAFPRRHRVLAARNQVPGPFVVKACRDG